MSWLALVLAGVFEVGWALALKQSHGFTRLAPTLITAVLMVASVGLLGVALRGLPLGTAYAIWTGIGTIGTAVVGIIVFGDAATAARLGSIALIVGGVLGLKLTAG